ncbi:MAG: metal-dependent hydrolase [Rhodospirillaceae bacterium]|nr:metal-dependent hydrolase [Rhodospirillaceae bacterium]|tara:strand:- start:11683 stop:12462 length:780 start_codon:yes stop_codon:yes gene_type:complete
MRLFLLAIATMSATIIGLAQTQNTIDGDKGEIIITPIIHSSAQVEYAGKVIHIDPWSAGDLSNAKPADLILITDDPGHHLDPEAIISLRKPEAPVVLTQTAYSKFSDGIVLANGESGTFADILIEAVGAYDMTPGLPYHPKGEANGYVINLGGKRLFFSGVGECIPEIQALENIDVAVMPMNLPVDRMRPIPVAECVKTFKPSIVYLNHYDRIYAGWLNNPQGEPPPDVQNTPATIETFQNAIAGEGIEFRDAAWYPGR